MSEIIFENTTNNITFAVDQPQINFQHTQPQISFTAVPGIGSGIEDAPIDGTNYLRKDGGWEKSNIVTDSEEYTVAADGDPAGVQDFDSFHEAMDYAISSLIVGSNITLKLQDGTHYIGPASFYNSDLLAYYPITNGSSLYIISSSDNASVCTITPSADYPNEYRKFFMAKSGSYLSVRNISFDAGLGGASHQNKMTIFAAWYGGNIWNDRVPIIGTDIYVGYEGFAGGYISAQAGDIDNCLYALSLAGSTFMSFHNSEIRNSNGQAIWCSSSSIAIITSVTFSNNAANSNIPINLLQWDRSFISDNTMPLQIDGTTGDTSARPDPVLIGTQYFDTDLGKPVWYDGTNWVDATGSTV